MERLKIIRDNSLTLEEAFGKFIRNCKIKDLSEYTITYYKKSYNYLTKYLKSEYDNPENMTIKYISKDVFNDFIYWLKDNYNMKNVTINTRLRGIRALLYYLMEQKYIERFKIDLLRTEKKIKVTYSDQELRRLLKKPNRKECNFAEYRNWVIVNFLLATGIRSRSLINIKIKDIDIEDATVHIKVIKNNRHQLIPLSKNLVHVIDNYIGYRDGENESYLFCTIYGKKMKSSSLNSAIRSYNLSHGVKKTSVHMFRHTFAKKWILNGGDAFRLQKILGHSSMKMVREYVNMYDEDLKKDFNTFNPLEEFNDNGEYINM